MEKFKEFWNFWHVCDFYVLTELHDISVIGSELQIFKKYWDKLTFLETEFYFWPQWTNLIFRWRKDRKIKKNASVMMQKRVDFWLKLVFGMSDFSQSQSELLKQLLSRNFHYHRTRRKIVTMSGFIINNDRIS